MRLSCDPGDPAFDRLATAPGVVVRLNGRQVADPITADEEQGLVTLHLRDGAGQIVTDQQGRPRFRTRRGVVQITLPYEIAVEICG